MPVVPPASEHRLGMSSSGDGALAVVCRPLDHAACHRRLGRVSRQLLNLPLQWTRAPAAVMTAAAAVPPPVLPMVETKALREWAAYPTAADREDLGRCIQIGAMAFHSNPDKELAFNEPEPFVAGASVGGRVEQSSGRLPQYKWDSAVDSVLSGAELSEAVECSFVNWRKEAQREEKEGRARRAHEEWHICREPMSAHIFRGGTVIRSCGQFDLLHQ